MTKCLFITVGLSIDLTEAIKYNLQGNPLCQCKLLSSIHAAKYRDIAHNLGSIAVLHNCTYVSSLRQLAVMVIFEETIIQVNE